MIDNEPKYIWLTFLRHFIASARPMLAPLLDLPHLLSLCIFYCQTVGTLSTSLFTNFIDAATLQNQNRRFSHSINLRNTLLATRGSKINSLFIHVIRVCHNVIYFRY